MLEKISTHVIDGVLHALCKFILKQRFIIRCVIWYVLLTCIQASVTMKQLYTLVE